MNDLINMHVTYLKNLSVLLTSKKASHAIAILIQELELQRPKVNKKKKCYHIDFKKKNKELTNVSWKDYICTKCGITQGEVVRKKELNSMLDSVANGHQ